MEITVVGSRAEQPVNEMGRDRYVVDLEVQDPTGRVTVVAEGSYVLRPEEDGSKDRRRLDG